MVLERDIRTQRDEKVRALQRTCLGECRVKLHDDAAALDAFTGAFGDDASLGAAALGRGRCLARLGRLTEASDALRAAASLGLGDAVVEAAACDVRGDDRARAVSSRTRRSRSGRSWRATLLLAVQTRRGWSASRRTRGASTRAPGTSSTTRYV